MASDVRIRITAIPTRLGTVTNSATVDATNTARLPYVGEAITEVIGVSLSLEIVSKAQLRLRLNASESISYRIQSSTNLLTWQDLTNGVRNGWFTDLKSPADRWRIYRAVAP